MEAPFAHVNIHPQKPHLSVVEKSILSNLVTFYTPKLITNQPTKTIILLLLL